MNSQIIRHLDNGLVIRHASGADAQTLAQFNKEVHGENEWDGMCVQEWTLDLVEGKCPTVSAKDFTIVEDTSTGEIVSSCCLISQTWSYEGIPFKVSRPELVGTKEPYRRQGLVRHQFEIMHQWSVERGELVQAITGIPYYYRQFGYEMTLQLGGWRGGYQPHVPKLSEEQTEPYQFRTVGFEDIPFLMDVYQRGSQRSMIAAVRDEMLWQYEIGQQRKYNLNRSDLFIIEDGQGTRVGFIGAPSIKWRDASALTLYEIAPGISWSDLTPGVVRFLWQRGERLAKEQNQTQERFCLYLGAAHPAYEVIASKLPLSQPPYTYYIRVADLLAFLRLIRPALEERLRLSSFANYTGTLNLSFYRGGVSIVFFNGKITAVKPLAFKDLESAHASFPPLTHLHLIFGHHTMTELKQAFTDCSTKNDETMHLLDSLFPKKPSKIWILS